MNVKLRAVVLVLAVAAAVGAAMRMGAFRGAGPEGATASPRAGIASPGAGVPAAVASGSPSSPEAGDPLARLRRQGRLDEAKALARAQYRETGKPRMLYTLLGLCEDSGRAADSVQEARGALKELPGDRYVQWMLARSLLFQAATDPTNAKAPACIDEAERLSDGLDKAAFTPEEAPGGRLILRMQIAFLRKDWKKADALAVQALAKGTTAGESADIVALRFDIAFREGRLGDAEALLDQVTGIVQKWTEPSYYQLRTYMEDVLEVRETLFAQHYTLQDVDRLAARHEELKKQGLVDSTLQSDEDIRGQHEALRTYARLRDQGDLEGQLRFLLSLPGFLERSKQPARCFYSEAVVRPFQPACRRILVGDILARLGRQDEARRYYEEGLRGHPGNRLLEQRLRGLGAAASPATL